MLFFPSRLWVSKGTGPRCQWRLGTVAISIIKIGVIQLEKLNNKTTSDGKKIEWVEGNAYVRLRDYEELEKELDRLKEQNNINARETST